MRARWLLAAVLFLPLVPMPVAQAASWSVEATVAVTSATSADYTWKITGLTNTRLTLPLPDDATFVEARDVDGKKLAASADLKEVEVTAGSKAFVIAFKLAGSRDGPFTLFPAQVASAADSPVTVGVTLPAGWTLAGYRDNDETLPDAKGVFRKTGPSYVEFLAAPPGSGDQGPDTRVSGSVVRREAYANVTASGTAWTLVTTYDADVYSRDWEIDVPEGATVVAASTPFGELETTPSADGVKVRTPYPVGYGLGGRSFTVEMLLAAPEAHGGAFRQANLSVRAAPGDTVRLTASVPDGAQYAGSRVAGGREVAPLSYEADGPLSVGVAYLPPAASGHSQFVEGAFVVDAPRTLEAAARATAKNATALLPRAASFAYDPADTRPFFVAYTDADIFSWEEGFYSNGLNTISIRASTLEDASDGKAHLVPVGVLVHEATHGLIDRRLPDAPHNLSFLHEGLSRLAETVVEQSFPDEIVACESSFLSTDCTRHSARPYADERQKQPGDLYERFRAGKSFDIAWGANDVPDNERGELYDYSGLVLHAYTQRAPPGALDNALVHVARTSFTGPDATDAAVLTDILLANAPGTTAQALLYPGAEAASLTLTQFRYCMGDLLAPAYPWEEARKPSGSCPASGYGPRDAQLPAPPTVRTETTPPATTTPPPPPPRVSPPVTGEDDIPGEIPGAVVDEGSGEGGQAPSGAGGGTQIEVPAPGFGPVALAVLAALLLTRRLNRR